MLFLNCCTNCDGDLLLEADTNGANLKCLRCNYASDVPANTHLFNVLCDETNPHQRCKCMPAIPFRPGRTRVGTALTT
jgi:hypothetical protein